MTLLDSLKQNHGEGLDQPVEGGLAHTLGVAALWRETAARSGDGHGTDPGRSQDGSGTDPGRSQDGPGTVMGQNQDGQEERVELTRTSCPVPTLAEQDAALSHHKC